MGAHAGDYNQLSTGVAVLGTFVSAVPSPSALEAVEHLLAWKLALHGVPAFGKVAVRVKPAEAFYTPFRPGQLVHLHRVAGHREGDSTDCPGDAFYARLPSMRPVIAGLAGTPLKLTLTADQSTVAPGTTVALAGQLAGLEGAPAVAAAVQIQTVDAGTTTPIATVTTDATGAFAASVPVTQTVSVRALHRLAPAAVSDVVTVAVAPVLTLALASSPPSPVRVSGTVDPPRARVTIVGSLASALLAEDDQPRARDHLLEEALVVPHHQLAVDLLHRLQGDADGDEQRRPGEGVSW